MLSIKVGTKLTSINFSSLIQQYWQKSLSEKIVELDLTKLEWIANEQMTFLVSWIRKLQKGDVKVKILLQTYQDIDTNSSTFRRRLRCLSVILFDWKIELLLIKEKSEFIYGITPKPRRTKPIPFQEIPAITYGVESFDEDYEEIYNMYLQSFITYVRDELKDKADLTYFDNHFLHYSIIKEFYSNVIQHANDNSIFSDCYLSLNVNAKIRKSESAFMLNDLLTERYEERPEQEKSFFIDLNNNFINNDFIEITFLDFGVGIIETLKEKYNNEDIEKLQEFLHPEHRHQTEDNRILEYAFLLFTSRYNFRKKMRQHDYIPRGLFIVKDIVRRYSGMLIVRSKQGKVIFDFSKGNNLSEIVRYDTNDGSNDNFPGTLITLVLPTREKNYQSEQKVSTTSEKATVEIEPTNLISIVNKSKRELDNHAFENEKEKNVALVDIFFQNIYGLFVRKNDSKAKRLILFDFAGIDIPTTDLYRKFIYFLAYAPMINDRLNICLYNVTDSGINNAYVSSEDKQLRSKGFFPRPIPCIFPNLNIEWIGITDNNLQKSVTEIWKGNSSNDQISDDIHHITGNVLEVSLSDTGVSIKTTIPAFSEIIDYINGLNREFVRREIDGKGLIFDELRFAEIDLNEIKIIKKDHSGIERAFITHSGKYQKEFLSFFEKLYLKEYRRLIATYLLFNYFSQSEFKEDYKLQNERKYSIDKLISVTLSSQIIARELMEISNKILAFGKKVEIVPLSNYYDFASEESFGDVNSKDNVLLVNDIISTGNLSSNIFYSLNDRKAHLISILSIVDTRLEIDKKGNPLKCPCISLNCYPIEKHDKNPFSSDAIRINPILNAPTIDDDANPPSKTHNVLLKSSDFFRLFDDSDLFIVGNLKVSTVHHLYFINTRKLFLLDQQNNFFILKLLIKKLLEKKALLDRNKRSETVDKIRQLDTELKRLKIHVQSPLLAGLHKAVKEIHYYLSSQDSTQQLELFQERPDNPKSSFDLVLYPFMSSITEIEDKLYPIIIETNKNERFEVFPIPRIMTPKGWRFSFPPRYLQLKNTGKKKTALIIDDGSSTGNTLTQLIDTCSFLDLTEVTVLSMISRLEDFQKEFFTKITEIKVNNKNVPITIFFGTHLNIPIYNRSTSPLFLEKTELEGLLEYGVDFPDYIKEYLKKRIKRLEVSSSLKTDFGFLIPRIINRKSIFQVRNLLGQFESYRLMSDSLDEKKQQEEMAAEILANENMSLAAVAVLSHEPALVKLVEVIQPELISGLSKFLQQKILSNEQNLSDIEFFHFMLQAFIKIDVKSFLNIDLTVSLIELIDTNFRDNFFDEQAEIGDIFSLIYISYLLLYFRRSKKENAILFQEAQIIIRTIWFEIFDKHKEDKIYYKYYRSLYDKIIPFLEDENKKDPSLGYFHTIKNYYGSLTIDFINHRNLTDYNNFEKLIAKLQGFINVGWEIKEFVSFCNEYERYLSDISNRLLSELKEFLTALTRLSYYPSRHDVEEWLENLRKIEEIGHYLERLMFKPNEVTKHFFEDLKAQLQQFNNLILSPDSKLSKFIRTGESNIDEAWKSALEEYNFSNHKNEDIKLVNQIPKNVKLNIHPFILVQVFMHILNNRLRYAPNSTCEYKAYLGEFKGKNSIIFYFKQDTPFINDYSGNRGLSDIRRMISSYGGEYYPISQTEYTFEIIFPLI